MKKTYRVSRYVDSYINDDRDYAFKLDKNFNFFIDLKEKTLISKLGIFFATYKKQCVGHMKMTILFDNETGLECTVDLARIIDNAPLVMDFGDKSQIAKKVTVSMNVAYTKNNPLAVWVNSRGVCAKIKSFENVVIELEKEPLISIVTPVYKTNLKLLKQTIKSVKDQKYKNWELCIVDDGSKDPVLDRYLKGLKDKRIRVKTCNKNSGISLSTNKGIGMAKGEYVCFLDHDDILEESALLEIAKKFEENPEAQIVYTDEDKISDTGQYYGQFYKPDWDYTMFLSYMYTCHLTAYRLDLVKSLGGLRPGYEGSQDYDLMLRAVEKTDEVYHIPLILYSWRASEGSTSLGIGNKRNARMSAVKALSDHIQRTRQDAIVEGGDFQGMYRARFMPKTSPRVTIIIPFRDNIEYVENLLYTINNTYYNNYKILLVNNRSKKAKSKKFIEDIKREKNKKNNKIFITDYNKPFNFSSINNYAVSRPVSKHSKYVLFLNNDTEVLNSSWLYEMVAQAERDGVAAVGAKLLYPDHSIQHAGLFIGVNGIAGHGHKNIMDWHPGYFARPHIAQEISAVTGACMLVNRDEFESVGGFDEDLPTAFNDVDLCLKLIQKGKKVIYTPYARLIHHESASRGLDNIEDPSFKKAMKYMDDKWGCLKYEDPHYNRNLTTTREDFSAGI